MSAVVPQVSLAIINVRRADNAMRPISPLAVKFPIWVPSLVLLVLATAANATGWNTPKPRLPTRKAISTHT